MRDQIDKAMQDLLLRRGTLLEIESMINDIGLRDDSTLEPFEENIEFNDIGFNTNLGQIDDQYLDYEVYLLPTNKQYQYIITEINNL